MSSSDKTVSGIGSAVDFLCDNNYNVNILSQITHYFVSCSRTILPVPLLPQSN